MREVGELGAPRPAVPCDAGLLGRGEFSARLSAALAPSQPGPIPVFRFRIDRFEALDDLIGDGAADRYLQRLADGLRAEFGASVCACLDRADLVLLGQVGLDSVGAEHEARRLRRRLTDCLRPGADAIGATVSAGVVLARPGVDSAAAALRHAGWAVMKAQHIGADHVVLCTDEMRAALAYRDNIETYLPAALRNGRLYLEYQPEIDLNTGRILAVEALLRWRHPTLGRLGPSSFIDIVEATDLAHGVGRWVLNRACRDLARWRTDGLASGVRLRVNVSPRQLARSDFADSVLRLLSELDLEPTSLCLEVTERTPLRDLERTVATLDALRARGVRIALDDFGAGHCSLAHLKKLQVDAIKIDGGFVHKLTTDSVDRSIVRTIVGLAHAFGLAVIAEGVETPEAVAVLLAEGCHRAQGYLLSRPLDLAAVTDLIAAGGVDPAAWTR
jgi:EAL domain-containing protein (putative c-di-GMP-specific phosphodiesterase class I)/GGDEF domain-containing protein